MLDSTIGRSCPGFDKVGQILSTWKDFNPSLATLVCIRGWDAAERRSVETSSIYPDKIFLVGNDVLCGARCATTPMKHLSGCPTILSGNYSYTRGIHVGASLPPYLALRQVSPVRVIKDSLEQTDLSANDLFHINIHRGLNYLESGSAGCIAIEPALWDAFMIYVDRAMSIANQSTIALLFREVNASQSWMALPESHES